MALPMKTTETDLEKVSGYLRNQVGWVELDRIRKAIPTKHANAMKIEAMRHLGLLDRDGENVKLTGDGREYASGDADKRAEILRKRLKADRLYSATLDWAHYGGKTTITKTEIANYWHDNHPDEIGGAKGDALTDSTVFFMRMAGAAGLGQFVAAGVGRETELRLDVERLEEFATGQPPPADIETAGDGPPPPPTPRPQAPQLTVGAGLNVNVEIHIAADAKPATIEEIFKNMRKYLIEEPGPSANGG
jgi:hypothetical protein